MNRTQAWNVAVLAVALALGSTASSAAQEAGSASASPVAEPAAAPAEQPRRRDGRRDGRRGADGAPVAAAAPATANPAAPAAAPAAATAETAEPKLICKNLKPIGSRVARRICGTEEQWAADNARTSADAEEGMRQIRDRSGVTGGSSSGPASLGNPGFGR